MSAKAITTTADPAWPPPIAGAPARKIRRTSGRPPIGSLVEHPTDRRAGRRGAAPRAGHDLVRAGAGCAVHRFSPEFCGRSNPCNRCPPLFGAMAAGYAAGDRSISGRPECRSRRCDANVVVRDSSFRSGTLCAGVAQCSTYSQPLCRSAKFSVTLHPAHSVPRQIFDQEIHFFCLIRMGPAVVGRTEMLQDR